MPGCSDVLGPQASIKTGYYDALIAISNKYSEINN